MKRSPRLQGTSFYDEKLLNTTTDGRAIAIHGDCPFVVTVHLNAIRERIPWWPVAV